jgi:hypothetical protein
VAHVKAVLVPQEAIILTIDCLVKFKRSFRAPERRRLGEAMVTIFDFLSPPKLNIFSQIFTNLFDIRLTLTKEILFCLSYLFHSTYAAIMAWPLSLFNTNQRDHSTV